MRYILARIPRPIVIIVGGPLMVLGGLISVAVLLWLTWRFAVWFGSLQSTVQIICGAGLFLLAFTVIATVEFAKWLNKHYPPRKRVGDDDAQ